MSNNANLGFELTKRIEGITRSMNRVTYEAVAGMVIRMDEVSPVATPMLWRKPNRTYVGGQFRGNWQLGVNYRPTGWLEGNIDPSGANTVAANIGRIPTAASRGHKFYLTNNTPYGVYLENGSVKMKIYPSHFILRAKREFNGMVRKIAAEVKSQGGRVK
jgi:hypothetical protein